MENLKFHLFRAFLFALASIAFAATPQESLKQADSYYAARAEGAKGDKADRNRIDKMIGLYRNALQDSSIAERAALGLYRSHYYRIRFASKNEDEKKQLVAKAKFLGDTLHARFPLNKEITSIYATILSSWGSNIGALKAVKEGVANRVRDMADSAGDYQILGRAHQLLPYIPLILSWPDKKLAYKYLGMSLKQHPEDLYTYRFLVELYIDDKKYDEADKLIQKGLAREVRKNFILEDKRGRYYLKELKKKLDKERH